MVCDLTQKLRFDEDPVLCIRDTRLTIKSDAEVVLGVMDALREQSGVTGAREALGLLLSAEDQKKLAKLGLKLDDYLTVFTAAVKLAMGEDPEDETPGE